MKNGFVQLRLLIKEEIARIVENKSKSSRMLAVRGAAYAGIGTFEENPELGWSTIKNSVESAVLGEDPIMTLQQYLRFIDPLFVEFGVTDSNRANILRMIKKHLLTVGEPADKLVFTTKKELQSAIADKLTVIGADVSHVICKSDHCRVFLNDLKNKKSDDLQIFAKDSIGNIFNTETSVKNIGKAHSGTFETYQVTTADGDVYNIVFSGGLSTGTRGGGYEYEDNLKNLLSANKISISNRGADTTVSDIFLKTKSGKSVGIEVKAIGAKFGQPTLHYDYVNQKFILPSASRSSDNATLTADVLNQAIEQNPKSKASMMSWLNGIKNEWQKLYPNDKMEILGKQISPEDWSLMMKGNIKQSGPSIPISVLQIINYYSEKEANYIQIKGKGLYTFSDDVLGINAKSFADAAGKVEAYVYPEMLTSGKNKVIRATISLNLKNLESSDMNLEDEKTLKKISKALSRN
jgi:hypothetical protein